MDKHFSFADVIKEPSRPWSRRGWNGEGQFIQLQVPDSNSKMTKPYFFITTVQGDRIPWVASQTDLLAKDWFVLSHLTEQP